MKRLALFLACTIAFSGCENEWHSNPFDIEFEILDADLNPNTSFTYGEDIVFAFKITNFTDTIIAWGEWPQTFDINKIYKVYKEAPDDKGNSEFIFYGSPYQKEGVIFFHEENYIPLSPGIQYRCIARWIKDYNQQPFPPGYYKCAFDMTIYFQDYEPVNKTFEKFFTVE